MKVPKKAAVAILALSLSLIAAGCVTVNPGSGFGDLVVIGRSTEVPAGTVIDGNAVVVGGSLEVLGQVRYDAIAIGGSVRVRPGGVVGGEAVALGGRALVDPGGRVAGNAVSIGLSSLVWPRMPSVPWMPRVSALGMALLALIIAALWGPNVRLAGEVIAREPARSSLLGLLTLALTPVALLLLIVTVLGIPLIAVLALLVAAAYLFGWAAVADLLGRRVLGLLSSTAPGNLWPVLSGALLLVLGGQIPFVSGLLGVAIWLIGVGAAVATRFGTREAWPPGPPAATPGTGGGDAA